MLIILIKPLTTKAYDRRASGDCGTSGYGGGGQEDLNELEIFLAYFWNRKFFSQPVYFFKELPHLMISFSVNRAWGGVGGGGGLDIHICIVALGICKFSYSTRDCFQKGKYLLFMMRKVPKYMYSPFISYRTWFSQVFSYIIELRKKNMP